MNSKNQKPSYTNDLTRYAGLGAQLLVSLGLAVFVGLKADRWLRLSIPLLVWALPFAVLCGIILKLVRETSKQKGDDTNKQP